MNKLFTKLFANKKGRAIWRPEFGHEKARWLAG